MTVIRKPKSVCRSPGCEVIINASEKGYCARHKKPNYRTKLDSRKAPGSAKFYGGHLWKKTRASYKILVPYCEQCKRERGIVKPGHTVHHTIERLDLEAKGESPYDFQYLEHVCFNCHQKELLKRRKA